MDNTKGRRTNSLSANSSCLEKFTENNSLQKEKKKILQKYEKNRKGKAGEQRCVQSENEMQEREYIHVHISLCICMYHDARVPLSTPLADIIRHIRNSLRDEFLPVSNTKSILQHILAQNTHRIASSSTIIDNSYFEYINAITEKYGFFKIFLLSFFSVLLLCIFFFLIKFLCIKCRKKRKKRKMLRNSNSIVCDFDDIA
ncbi:conserved Plasmodium protein, unknown function [Plasmodium ovale]|uniref:Uncharacterized protein n=1 Tax=Plasmodium ovale TaxID=36330 RepID=A0A1C3KXM5_PLAOA|nr:conserved Plasmodium protein, unknown function [Plasmodium ovale]